MYARVAAQRGDPGAPKSSLLMNECSLTFTHSVMVSSEFAISCYVGWSLAELEGKRVARQRIVRSGVTMNTEISCFYSCCSLLLMPNMKSSDCAVRTLSGRNNRHFANTSGALEYPKYLTDHEFRSVAGIV